VYAELEAAYKAGRSTPDAEVIDGAIRAAFNRLDDDITYKSVDKVLAANSKSLAAHLVSPAIAGSCALLSFYDSKTQLLRVACTGDSRAILESRMDCGLPRRFRLTRPVKMPTKQKDFGKSTQEKTV
jgi:pyruvate dehydrogenase phosphatase